jgi:hypothetical protein
MRGVSLKSENVWILKYLGQPPPSARTLLVIVPGKDRLSRKGNPYLAKIEGGIPTHPYFISLFHIVVP